MVSDETSQLRAAVLQCGFHPGLVWQQIAMSLAGEPVVSWLVQAEPTFDRDELRRHVTVLALTPTRLVAGHTDEESGLNPNLPAAVLSSTESIPLDKVNGVLVSTVVGDPEKFGDTEDGLTELTITLGCGVVSQVDLLPAQCDDPECTADHGFTGTINADGVTVRVTADVEGKAAVAQAVRFAQAATLALGPGLDRV